MIGSTGHGEDGGATGYTDADEHFRATGGSGGTTQTTSSIIAVQNGEGGDAEGATGGSLVGHAMILAGNPSFLAMGGGWATPLRAGLSRVSSVR